MADLGAQEVVVMFEGIGPVCVVIGTIAGPQLGEAWFAPNPLGWPAYRCFLKKISILAKVGVTYSAWS